MNSLLQIIKAELLGIVNVAVMVVPCIYVMPQFFLSSLGILICSFIVGCYLVLCAYMQKKQQEKNLLYSPSGEYQERFEKEMSACGMNPNNVSLKYAYMLDGNVALNNMNMVLLDPILYSVVADDPQATKVKAIFDAVVDQMSQVQCDRHAQIKEIFSLGAQMFIFRHELAHVVYNYGYKKMFLVGLTGVIFTYAGIVAGLLVLPFVGAAIAVLFGMVVAGFVDLFLSYASNIFFKVNQERKADFFAVQHSSAQEINEAADFFERHIAIVNTHNEYQGILRAISVEILSGHPDTTTRVAYLRKMAAAKVAA